MMVVSVLSFPSIKTADSVLGTVITSCSDTWNLNGPFSLASAVKEELKNRERPFIESAEDVAHMILRTSINFFKREGPTESKFQDCFVSSINDTVSQFN
jgi:hypothetical protein